MKLKLSTIVALALASSASLGAAEKMTTGTINVISTTPLPSIGLPLNIIPANIQIFDSKDLRNQPGVTFADQLMNNAQGITFNEIQGNLRGKARGGRDGEAVMGGVTMVMMVASPQLPRYPTTLSTPGRRSSRH